MILIRRGPGLTEEVETDLFSPYGGAALSTELKERTALAAIESDGFRFDTSTRQLTEYDPWFLLTRVALDWAIKQLRRPRGDRDLTLTSERRPARAGWSPRRSPPVRA
ncbi:hypothetical protein [Actinoallomurus soli]|uniref:hypothetical protein n=1 Tax=Actinoallomurus soli TaxID=2952535 RepID=UPI002091F1B0|nr:hypothetical protein [Actinoallomurus soli]MCO5975054.1 hypothetical protein [Actinoallomurus soli]